MSSNVYNALYNLKVCTLPNLYDLYKMINIEIRDDRENFMSNESLLYISK